MAMRLLQSAPLVGHCNSSVKRKFVAHAMDTHQRQVQAMPLWGRLQYSRHVECVALWACVGRPLHKAKSICTKEQLSLHVRPVLGVHCC